MVEFGLRGAIVAERHQGATADTRGIGQMLRRDCRALVERAARIVLKQPGMGEQVAGLVGRHARLPRPIDLRFRGDAVTEGKLDPRLHDPRGAVARIGLERVHELDPGRTDVAFLERPGAALMGAAARIRAGGNAWQQCQGKEEAKRFHGCRSYCFSRS